MSTTDLQITIRRAELPDAAAIAEIYNEVILTTTAIFDAEPKTVEEHTRWLQSHDERHPVLVAEVDGRVVGRASLSSWSDRCAYTDTAESSLYVHSAHRGRSIGRRLKEAIIQSWERIPIPQCTFSVDSETNHPVGVGRSRDRSTLRSAKQASR